MRILAFATLASVFLPVGAFAEAIPRRVVLLDALELTPALEKANARQRVRDAVMVSVREHGWEPVAISTECHDFGCAGTVASSAKTLYVLILVGRFVPNELFATDVGVSLWRDGGIVSRRTEADEVSETQKPASGPVLLCGPPGGACTLPLLTSKLQAYSVKILDQESAAIREKETAAAAAAAGPPAARVMPRPVVPSQDDGSQGRILGWSLVGVGAALIAGGAGLWAFNNSEIDCHDVPNSGCRKYRQTTTAAAIVGVAGVAALGGGVVMLLLNRNPTRVALSLHPSGVIVGGTF
jgi:hypothetical protein